MSEIIESKTSGEIKFLRDAAKIAGDVLARVRQRARAGVTTKELDTLARKLILKSSAEPAFLGYRGYPATLCVSINEELVHGIPSDKRVLEDGDIVSLDLGVKYRGFYGDLAETIAVGKVPPETRKLMKVTHESLMKGIKQCFPGKRIGDVSHEIETYVESMTAEPPFRVVRDYVGHGIGRQLHEKPEVPNFGRAGTGPAISSGMVFNLEPMVTIEDHRVVTLDDGWTVITENGRLCAHYEHTVLVTDNGPEILTSIQAPA